MPPNATAIIKVLELPESSNVVYKAKMREMDLGWLRDKLVDTARWDKVYWHTSESIISADWSTNTKRWLHLVTRTIRLLGNRTHVTFSRALMVACAVLGIGFFGSLLTLGVQ